MSKDAKNWSYDEIVAAEDTLINFQFAVLDRMQEKGISNVQLAEMLGVSRARVTQMLSSEANPTIKLVGRTLHLLGLECDYVSSKKAGTPAEVSEQVRNRGEIEEQFALMMSRRPTHTAPTWRQTSVCANNNMNEPRKAA